MSNLIDKDKLIRWIMSEINPYGRPTMDYDTGIKIINYLENLPQENQRTDEWISVNEKLPDKNGDYLATIKYTIYDQTKFMIVVKSFFGDQDWQDGFVVAWMELPEIYTENNNE